VLALAGCASDWFRAGSGEKRIPVGFSFYSPESRTVCVAGSFNGWSTVADCMKREGDRWSYHLSLPPGKYDYLLVLDDEKWVLDPGAAFIDDNGFGGANSILIVE
jgi:1,4-alpha-glucan branching enzyme